MAGGATACLFHLPLQALVATITKLKAKLIAKKTNDGNPPKR